MQVYARGMLEQADELRARSIELLGSEARAAVSETFEFDKLQVGMQPCKEACSHAVGKSRVHMHGCAHAPRGMLACAYAPLQPHRTVLFQCGKDRYLVTVSASGLQPSHAAYAVLHLAMASHADACSLDACNDCIH